MFASLLTIVLVTALVRILDRASQGKLDQAEVLPIVLLTGLGALPLAISLTIFLSVFLVLGRWWRDSEMIVWLSSGASVWSLVRPVLKFSLPLVVLVALCSLLVSPWARMQVDDMAESFRNRPDLQRVTPGQFRESSGGDQVFFVEATDDSLVGLGTVFSVGGLMGSALTVLYGESGSVRPDDQGLSWVTVGNGSRADFRILDGSPHDGFQETVFSSYSVLSEASGARISGGYASLRSMPTMLLFRAEASNLRGELAFRLGAPLVALALSLLAIPLSHVGQRSSSWYSLVLALLVVVVTNNLLSVSQSWVAQGIVDFHLGWWPLPISLVLIFYLSMWARVSMVSISMHALRALVVRSFRAG